MKEIYMETDVLKNATILVVDDNPVNLNLLSDFLTDAGFTVLLKKDGEKALALIQRKQPDIILLDILMPGMDGFETCRRLKSDPDTEDIPVIFMTALSETVDKIRGFELGAVDYITKPFHHEEVLARVRTHLTIQNLKNSLEEKNIILQEALERERKLLEDIRLNLSLSLPHELRTPLNAVLGFSDFLTDVNRLPEPERIAEYGKAIRQSGLRLNRLVENSLLYANLKLLKYTSEDNQIWPGENRIAAGKIITEICVQMAEERERQRDLGLEISDVMIRINPENLKKILTELLDNAFKFSMPGSPVSVKLTISACLCILSISDKGRGMGAEQIRNIGAFMQFDRKRHEQQGSGLGLIIAWLLARLEGGILSVTSEPGKGCTVSIVLKCDTVICNPEDSVPYVTKKVCDANPAEISCVFPLPSCTKKLHELISSGHISGILEELDRIEKQDAQYREFAAKLRNWTNNFEIRKIRDFMEKHMNHGDGEYGSK